MSALYLDSSSIVKRYSVEKGTNFVIGLLRPSAKNRIYSSKISEVEVCAAFSRKQKGLIISTKYAQKAVSRFRCNFSDKLRKPDVTDSIINEAVRLTETYALRGYDAVQLATALETNRKRLLDSLSRLIFVSADNELNNAAQAEGLTIENPNNYR